MAFLFVAERAEDECMRRELLKALTSKADEESKAM